MAKNAVADWDTTAANNTDISGTPLAEGSMFPRHVNDAIRSMMAQLAVRFQATPPTGSLAFMSGTGVPDGYLAGRGQTVNRLDYPNLWAYAQASGNLATTEAGKTAAQYGPGDGTTTFSLPNYPGYAFRAWNHTASGIDASRDIGTVQASQNLAHSHDASTASAGAHTHTGTATSAGSHTHTGTANSAGAHTHDISRSEFSGNDGEMITGTSDGGGGNIVPDAARSAGAHTHSLDINSGGAHSHTLSINSGGAHEHTVTVAEDGGTEARMHNIAVLVCIKT